MWVTSSPTTALTPTAIALGNFDGLHRGHRQVVEPILNPYVAVNKIPDSLIPGIAETQESGNDPTAPRQTTALNSLSFPGKFEPLFPSDRVQSQPYSTVVTFNPHPQAFFSGSERAMLTPLDEKVALLREIGAQQLVLLPFDKQLASLSPREFVEKILVHHLRATRVSVGENFRFGHRRTGSTDDLQKIGSEYGIAVTVVPLQTCQGERISSSQIRSHLTEGNLKDANRLLGRPYSLTGVVVAGQQLGRTLGFPTANLQIVEDKFLPKQGVYAVRVYRPEAKDNPEPVPAVMNIGCRPTLDGKHPTIEVHLLDWAGDLYGQTLTVSLEEFLRPEQKFPSLEALKAQIQADCRTAIKVLIGNG